nr:hypothetical protein [Tanacetum cinerariifolium]
DVEIKKAYKKMILLTYPDKCLEFSEALTIALRRVVDAYNTLADAATKKQYDQTVPTTKCWS